LGVAPEHTLPHAPQAAGVLKAASQPLFGFESQSPKPVLQLGLQNREPAEPLHCVEPFEFVHWTLHEPHAAVVLSCVSQPGAAVQLP
jgi:hypothetical protein